MILTSKNGSSSAELAIVMPFFALFVLLTAQFGNLFDETMVATKGSSAEVKRLLNDWQIEASDAFERPCIERINPQVVFIKSRPVKIGVNIFAREVSLEQGVAIVGDEVCAAR